MLELLTPERTNTIHQLKPYPQLNGILIQNSGDVLVSVVVLVLEPLVLLLLPAGALAPAPISSPNTPPSRTTTSDIRTRNAALCAPTNLSDELSVRNDHGHGAEELLEVVGQVRPIERA